jgi:hypothetical protein
VPRTLAVTVALLAFAAPAFAGAPAPIPHPIERAFRAPVVVVGKVTSIEKDTVDAAPYPGLPKVAHKVAVVKIETNLAGAAGLTHLKVGFVPPAKPDPKAKRDPRERPAPDLKEGQEMLFFLTKHADGAFYAMPNMLFPVDAKAADYKAQVEAVTKALAAAADPAKALAAEKAEDRFHAALALVTKYRLFEGTRDVEAVPIAADENRLILKALAEGDWSFDPRGVRLNGFIAVYRLGLSEADGWKAPGGKQGEEYHETMRKAFVAWVNGPGKEFRIKKFVPTKK